MKLPLRNIRGKVIAHALVDSKDYKLVRNYGWYRSSDGYVKSEKNRKTISIHRVITNAPKGMEVDHINGNKLDNRRGNLRICTHAENMKNGKLRRTNTSGHKGVSKSGKYWMAKLGHNGKRIYGGSFKTKEEAAKRYAELSKQYHGEYGRLT